MTDRLRNLGRRVLGPTWLTVIILTSNALAKEDSQWQQPARQQCPHLYRWTDTCSVYVLKDGKSAILIDLGDGTVLSHLGEIGVTKVDWVLFTHHHREQCQGFPRLRDENVKTAAPAVEQAFFERPATFRKMKPSLGDPLTVYGASYVRPPVEPISIDKPFRAEDTFAWRGYRLRCLETPGNSPGSMTYVLDVSLPDGGNQSLAFSGDVMLDGARMHTWFDTEWDYGFAKGLKTLITSADRLAKESPARLLPSHGPIVADPKEQLADYGRKLRELATLYVRGYPVHHLTDKQRDPLSQPTAVPEIFQVTPHLYKFNRPGEGSNFSIIVADSGQAIVSDCGLMSPEFLDRAIAGMRKHLGLKQIDAMVISHMHGDHFLLGEHLRKKYGTRIWTLDRIADKCERPEHYDYAAMIQSYNSGVDRLTIDRRLRDGEVINWEGYRLQVDWMPGQTEFGCCLWLKLDGKRIAFTGDNIFGNPADTDQDGHEAVVARNSAVFEEGYLYAANYLKKLQPDLLMGGHSFVMPEPAAFIDRYHRWAQDIILAYQGLLPGSEYRYRFDPYWVKAEPYRVSLEPGRSAEVQVVVRNFRKRDQHHRIEICTPPGITAKPPVLEGVVGSESRASFPVRLHAKRDAKAGVHIVAFDITIDGQRYGQWFDSLVQVTTPSAGAQDRAKPTVWIGPPLEGVKQSNKTAAVNTDDRLGEMITIPAGSFLMGNNGHEGFAAPEEFPQHSVNLATYQIGKYEVTRGQYRKFIEAGGYRNPRYWSPEGWKWKESDTIDYAGMHGKVIHTVRPNSKEKRNQPEHWTAEQEWIGHGYGHPRFIQTDNHPVVGVTYYEAEAYCKWAGGRLPTEAEWEKAARWDKKKQHANTWPWGDTWDPEKCNNAEDHNRAAGGYKKNQSAPVGSYPDGASPYGCMDMVGNAYEWVADWHKSYPGSSKPFDHTNRYRCVKGACWDDGPLGVRCAYRGWYLPPSSSGTGPGDSDYIGFRVAR